MRIFSCNLENPSGYEDGVPQGFLIPIITSMNESSPFRYEVSRTSSVWHCEKVQNSGYFTLQSYFSTPPKFMEPCQRLEQHCLNV